MTSRNLKLQNVFVVVTSYVFYGWWDWRFLSLIVISTVIDYFVGRGLSRTEAPSKRKTLLWTSIVCNLGFLGFFKYYNFFLENFVSAFSFFGSEISPSSLNVILPVGISFYTFQTMSYSIDVYRRRLEPTRDFVAFSAFVSFFPQLVAGPIERATNLLPQFYSKRVFRYDLAVSGMRQILWGLFKKIVIADNCAEFANLIFDKYTDHSGSTLVLGAIFFAFQIYGDFSGYSDIAIGLSRLLGFDLMQNFAFPYFSRDIAEFWRRWHISLSTWFRDYVYIPLGGSRGGTLASIRNTFIIFIVSGFWHGANWTFIVWGALNAVYFLPIMLAKKNRANIGTVAEGRLLPSVKDVIMIGATFGLTLVAWIFFRASSLSHALGYLRGIASPSLFTVPAFDGWGRGLETLVMVTFFLSVEWCGRHDTFALERIGLRWKSRYRLSFYGFICILIFLFIGKEQQFIYFQF